MSANDEGKPKRPRLRWQAWHSSLVAGGAAALTLTYAGPTPGTTWIVAALTVATGTLVGVAHARRLYALLAGTAFGVLAGLLSSFDFLGPDVSERFPAVAATIAVYLVLGFVVGAFFEIVLFLHHLAHGRKPSEYRRLEGE